MSEHAPRQTAAHKLANAIRRRPRPRIAVAALVSLAISATVGMVLYAASSLTFLASEPLADPRFGPQNACALRALKDSRTGFAVGPDGSVAVYSGSALVLCAAGALPSPRAFELSGVTSAALDFGGTLWVARRVADRAELHKLTPGAPSLEQVGDLRPTALVGHLRGVVALESSGRIVSLASSGEVLAVSQLPEPPLSQLSLAANADGTLVSITTAGGVFVVETEGLKTVRAESPCTVEWAWWLENAELLLSCGPDSSFALRLDARSGAREEAQRLPKRPSFRVPGLGAYVEDCGDLPCSTRPPI